jgi:uncharacterized LabA/DUF88 family protein
MDTFPRTPPRVKPAVCRAHVFFDGQGLFHAAKRCFGYRYPNYDPLKLAAAVTALEPDRILTGAHFYTGVPSVAENPLGHAFWTNKLNALARHGVHVVQRTLKYGERAQEVFPDVFERVRVGREKGIDVRLCLDLVRLARRREYDVAIIFSQDQDLLEAIDEVKAVSKEIGHWIRLESAFPIAPSSTNSRGINGTSWRPLDRAFYDACLDPIDYRPERRPTNKIVNVRV